MGWFDFLFGKKSPQQPLSPRKALERAWAHWWKLDDAERQNLLEAWFREALAGRGELRVLLKEPETELQVRGHLGRVPFRVKLDMRSMNMDIEARFPNPRGFIDLEWDPEAKPNAPIDRDPVWDEEDEKRVFLATHIFIEGCSADEEAESFRQLPSELQRRVLQEIADSHLRFFRIRPEGTEISPHRLDGKELQAVFDLPRILDLLQALSEAVPHLPVSEAGDSEETEGWEDEQDADESDPIEEQEMEDEPEEEEERASNHGPQPPVLATSPKQKRAGQPAEDPHQAWLRELASRDPGRR
jgi:hypothetical protein